MPIAPVLAAEGLQAVDYLVVLAYMVGLIGVGVYLSRRQQSGEQFFVGDRQMPWFLVGVSMLATLMSTLTYLGLPGELIKNGVAIATALAATPFAFLVIGYIWVPFYMSLGLTSAYEYLDKRFGFPTRMLGVGLYLYMRFVWIGAILYTMSFAVAEMTRESGPAVLEMLSGGQVVLGDHQGWFFFVLISTGIISTIYTALGGIKGLIWIDFMHFSVLLTGAIVTLLVIFGRTGTQPLTWWHDATQQAHELPPLASWDLSLPRTVLWTVLSGFFWHTCTHASDQVALQLYFTTRSARDARRSAAVNYILDASMLVLLALVGMALLSFYLRVPSELPPGVPDPRNAGFADRMFPYFIAHSLPAGLAGLVVAGVFAVAQSSVDSGINSTATVISVDLVRKLRRTPLGGRAELRLARGLTLGLGALVTLIAAGISLTIGESNIIDLQLRSFNCVLGPLGAIFMAGILLPHVGQRAILIAGTIGAVSGLVLGYGDLIPGVRTSPSSFLVIPLSWLATFSLAALLGSLCPAPAPEQLEGLTWTRRRRDGSGVAEESRRS
jgi:SSS family solute:Na+ symporter